MAFHDSHWFPGGEEDERRFGTPAAERMVRYHEQWLSAALVKGRRIPRIPTRRVEEGGYAMLLATPGGRVQAEHWWMSTLNALPTSDEDGNHA